MDKFVSYDKKSKKEKRLEDNKKRNCWNVSPVTKVVPDKTKQYNRQKFKKGIMED